MEAKAMTSRFSTERLIRKGIQEAVLSENHVNKPIVRTGSQRK